MVNTKKICAHHIDEECIKEKILSKGKKGKCSYCKRKTRKVVDLKYVIDLIEIGINYFFEHPAESRNLNPNTESGFDGQTYYFQDIWNEFICLLGINEDALSEDIFTILNNPSFYVFKHEFGSIADYYLDSWDSFKRFVTHETRFVFDIKMNRYYYSHYYYMNPKSLLEELQNFIMDLNLFTQVSVVILAKAFKNFEKNFSDFKTRVISSWISLLIASEISNNSS